MANGGGGALEAAQQASGNIVPENVKMNQVGVEGFLNAWATATQLKLKKSEIEGKMQALAEKNRQLEFMDGLREKQYAQRAYIDQAKLGLAEKMGDARAYNAYASQMLGQEKVDATNAWHAVQYSKYQDRIDAQTGMAQVHARLAKEGYYPGKPGYAEKYAEYAAPFNGKLATGEWEQDMKGVLSTDNNAILQQQKILGLREKRFKENTAAELTGNKDAFDPKLFLNPETLEPWVEPGGWFSGGKVYQPGRATKDKMITYTPPGGGDPVKRRVSSKRLTEIANDWSDLQKQFSQVPSLHNDPSMGVTPPESMPKTKGELEINHTYITGKGNKRWTGTGFVDP